MKTLLIVDQLRYDVARRFFTNATPIRLDYIPRATPVGHATISTGTTPSVHGVQGRKFWNHRLGRCLNLGQLPLDPGWGGLSNLRGRTLFERIRSESPGRGLVCVAAKAFIPFLFGAWAADICVYPATVRPKTDAEHPYPGRTHE